MFHICKPRLLGFVGLLLSVSLVEAQFSLPSVPVPSIPNPLERLSDAAAKKEAELRKAAADREAALRRAAEEKARQLAELEKQARRIQELEKQVRETFARFERLRAEAEAKHKQYKRIEEIMKGDSSFAWDEAYRELQRNGVAGSNKATVKAQIDKGLSVTIWGKEFSHAEEFKFAKAIAESFASANPAPLMAYVATFIAESKAQVMKNLEKAPKKAREKIEKEFNKIATKAIQDAYKGKTPSMVTLEDVTLTIAFATYNHWFDVRYEVPELVPTQKILNVQLYEIRMVKKQIKIPLPNTHQPYAKLEVKLRK